MSTDTVDAFLRARADDPGVALRAGDEAWTWREATDAAIARAALLLAERRDGPLHVGVLADNIPEYVHWLSAAGLAGATVVGINPTRRGAELARDITHTECQVLVVDPSYRELLDGLDLGGGLGPDRVWHLDDPAYLDRLAAHEGAALDDVDAALAAEGRTVGPEDLYLLLFTSGTSGAPKAVKCTQGRLARIGGIVAMGFGLGPSSACYLSMPLFHSNALMAGWSVALTAGAAMAPATFSASGLLDDLRHYGVTYLNYVGKPLAYVLATPEQPDDHDNPLRVAFGNEATDRDIDEFSRRFGCTVWDGFGSTEGAVIITREDDCPPGSVGRGFPGVAIYNSETLQECATARFDASGALANPGEAIGEIVNTTGGGMFGGYYNDPNATDERLRHGMYWSGDLGYRDADGWIYLAGRTADWMRVDGENMAAAPIERIILRLPEVSQVAVYPVPDERVGDQVMAAIVLADGTELTPETFGDFLAIQSDLSPKAWPRHVWIADRLPATATNKVIKRELVARGANPSGGRLWTREPRGRVYTARTAE